MNKPQYFGQAQRSIRINPFNLFFSPKTTLSQFREKRLFQTYRSELLNLVPKGHGEPVLLLPGFAMPDSTFTTLHHFLKDLGYTTYTLGLGLPISINNRITLEALKKRVTEILEKHPGEKVRLVGWSMGGIYASEAAKACPDLVSSVVTLSAPLRYHDVGGRGENIFFIWFNKLTKALGFYNFFFDPKVVERMHQAPSVPTTNLYSWADNISHGAICSYRQDQRRSFNEAIEVNASHMGIRFNPQALITIADRLAQSPENWMPFDKEGYNLKLKNLPGYPCNALLP